MMETSEASKRDMNPLANKFPPGQRSTPAPLQSVDIQSSGVCGVPHVDTAGSTFSSFQSQVSYNTVAPPTGLAPKGQRRKEKTMAWREREAQKRFQVKFQASRGPNPRHFQAPKKPGHTEQRQKIPGLMRNLEIKNDLSHSITPETTSLTGTIEYSPEYMLKLRSLTHPLDILKEKGYVLQQLSEQELERKKKCFGCGKAVFRQQRREPKPDEAAVGTNVSSTGQSKDGGTKFPTPEQGNTVEIDISTEALKLKVNREPIIRCKFHNGVVNYKIWSCCRKHVSAEPCTGSENHVPRHYTEGELENRWRYYETPAATASSSIRHAVAIDCEMGTSKSGDSELIRVTMIDYFSSAVLVDSLVYPDVEMDHLNTRYSGVTWKQMKEALQTNKCLLGQKAARKAVWKFVGPDTVVVGHSPHNDLTAMRWIHHTVVDTYLIDYLKAREKMIEEKMAEEKRTMEQKAMEATGQNVAEPVPTPALPIEKDQQAVPKRPKGSGNLALKTMTLEKLGRKIQMGGNKGHDSLEDAIASRDLAHWNVLRGAEIRDEDAAAEYLCEDGGVRL